MQKKVLIKPIRLKSIKIPKSIVINKHFWGIILLLFPFVQQRSMQEFPLWLKMTYEYGAVLSATIIYLYAFYKRKEFSNSFKRLWIVFIFWAIYVFSTILNKPQEILYTGRRAYVMLAIALFIDLEIQRNAGEILKALAFFYATYVLLNNVLVLLFPTGIYQVKTSLTHKGHLLGDDNAIIYVALPGMIFLSIYSIYKYNKITTLTWINIVLCEIVLIRLWSGSAMICFGIFILILFLGTKIKRIPGKVYLIATTVLSVFVFLSVYYKSISSSGLFSLVFSILGKNSTFSNREYMWVNAINMIFRKPIFGYGGYYQVGTYISRGGFVYPSHTPYLQILLDGGIVLFIPFVVMIIMMFKCIDKNIHSYYSQVIIAGMTGILLSYVFEYTQLYHVMILFSIATNIPNIIAQNKLIGGELS